MTPTDTRPDARAGAGAQLFGAGTVYTLLAALGFGAVSTLTSIALAERAGLWNVLMWRYVIGAVVMVAFVGTQHYPRMPRRESMRFIAIGGGGQALLVGLALSSLKYITVAKLGFLFLTYPAWVTLVQAVRGAERLTARRFLALALSFGGIVVIGAGTAAAGPAGDTVFRVSGLEWKGVALALGAAVVYGVYIPTMQYLQKAHPVPVTSAYAKIGSAICFLLIASGTQQFTLSLTVTAWEAILALTLFSTVLPSVFFLMGLMRLGPVRTAIVSTIEPFFTAVLGALVLLQPITPSIILGGAMIAAAVVVLQYRRERVA
jgi:drug/metabolite transporter (DMT)-like permease